MTAVQTGSDPAAGINTFLATDVGGTHARVALVRADAHGAIEILDHHKYHCAEFPGLAPILAEFLAGAGRPRVDDAAIGCAGIVRDDMVITSNLPWRVSLAELRALGIAHVHVVNDFVALAHAEQCMNSDDSRLLTPGVSAAPPGPTLVIGPGTGLGAAYRVPLRGETLVLPSEAGQLAFAPGTLREIAVLRHLLAQVPYVANEHLISGPGLLRLYQTLCAIDAVPARQTDPADIADAARRGSDVQALESVMLLCAMLGSVIGDLVLAGGATSVYIAGGIMPKIQDFLQTSDFHARFINKGVLRPLLERVPVRLIENPHKGVIGAASWYLSSARN